MCFFFFFLSRYTDDTDEALPVDDGEGNPTTVDYKATVTKCNDTIKHSKNPTAAAASTHISRPVHPFKCCRYPEICIFLLRSSDKPINLTIIPVAI